MNERWLTKRAATLRRVAWSELLRSHGDDVDVFTPTELSRFHGYRRRDPTRLEVRAHELLADLGLFEQIYAPTFAIGEFDAYGWSSWRLSDHHQGST